MSAYDNPKMRDEIWIRVYAEHFASIGATRTTLAVSALPTPIAVEMKVIAEAAPAPVSA